MYIDIDKYTLNPAIHIYIHMEVLHVYIYIYECLESLYISIYFKAFHMYIYTYILQIICNNLGKSISYICAIILKELINLELL
jgi:hypothetical protein